MNFKKKQQLALLISTCAILFVQGCYKKKKEPCINMDLSKIEKFNIVNPLEYELENIWNVYSGKSNLSFLDKSITIDWEFYLDESEQLGISFPSGWVVESADSQLVKASFGKSGKSHLIVLAHSKEQEEFGLDQFSELLVKRISIDTTLSPELYSVNSSDLNLNNYNHYKLVDRKNGTHFQIILADFCTQLFDITMKIDKEDLFNDYDFIFQLIANSIRVKNNHLLEIESQIEDSKISFGVE